MKLFIADPALASFQGHHFSLTSTFSDAACQQGLEVIWLTNKRLPVVDFKLPANVRIERVFSEGTYDSYKLQQASKTPQPRIHAEPALKRGWLYERARRLYHLLPDTAKAKIKGGLYRVRPFDRLFSTAPEAPAPVKQAIVHSVYDELRTVIAKYGAGATDSILFHTCDAHTYFDIVQLFLKAIPFDKWGAFPVLHLSTPYDEGVMPHNKTSMKARSSIRYLSSLGLIGQKVFLYAENDLLAKYLAGVWSVNVNPLFIPQKPFLNSKSSKEKSPVIFSYLGAAREEKGFVYIANALQAFLSMSDRQDIRFELQVSAQILGYPKIIQASVDSLKALNDNRLHLITEPQTPDDYSAALLRADALLLCYDPDRYSVRSSGIISEALANGKIAITTESTFPSHIAKEAACNVRFQSVDDFVSSVTYIADNLTTLSAQARERSRRFLEETSPVGFFAGIKNATISAGDVSADKVALEYNSKPLKINWKKLI